LLASSPARFRLEVAVIGLISIFKGIS
jgi:hypothetical protein